MLRDEIERTFSEEDKAWTLYDRTTGGVVTIPAPGVYEGKKVVRFFLKKDDAEAILLEAIDMKQEVITNQDILPIEVPIFATIRILDAQPNPEDYVILLHTPNEMHDWRGKMDLR